MSSRREVRAGVECVASGISGSRGVQLGRDAGVLTTFVVLLS